MTIMLALGINKAQADNEKHSVNMGNLIFQESLNDRDSLHAGKHSLRRPHKYCGHCRTVITNLHLQFRKSRQANRRRLPAPTGANDVWDT
eukprot:6197399-Pleurochrysis_carterae.AAC.1